MGRCRQEHSRSRSEPWLQEVLLHRVEWCGCRMVGSRPELPDNLKGSPGGWQKAQRGRCRRQEAEPTAAGAESPEEQGRIRRGLGAGLSSSALPGVARPRALHPRAVLLRQDTHRADFKRERIRATTNGHMGQSTSTAKALTTKTRYFTENILHGHFSQKHQRTR